MLKGLLSSSVGLIASAGITIIAVAFFGTTTFDLGAINISAIVVFAISLILLRKFKLNPMLIIAASGVIGLILY